MMEPASSLKELFIGALFPFRPSGVRHAEPSNSTPIEVNKDMQKGIIFGDGEDRIFPTSLLNKHGGIN